MGPRLLLMGGKPSTAATDPYFSSVIALLHGNGANNGTTFTDVKGKTITRGGNAITSTTQSLFNGSSVYLDGVGDYLEYARHTDWNFGSADFTVEGAIYPLSITKYMDLFSSGEYDANQFTVRMTDTGKLQMYFDSGAAAFGISTGTTTLTLNAWNRWAVSKVSGVTRLFLNGVVESTNSTAFTVTNTTGTPRIGKQVGAASFDCEGYMAEFRATLVGRYSGAYTPSATAFPDA